MEKFTDPSLPSFKYTQSEREQMIKNGLTEEQINQKEALANLKLTEKALEDESRAA
jgi:hypothetical protein